MKRKRRPIYENEKLILHSEVGGVCPLCPTILIYEKDGVNDKAFEIAHIYPLNPRADEITLLKNEELLNSDPDNQDNLICLCIPCHRRYDKNKTVEEYRDLVQKKKKILKVRKEKEIWTSSTIEKEIYQIIELLSNQDFDLDDNIEYNPKTIDTKTNTTITALTKRKIHQNVQDYFYQIKHKFTEIELIDPLSTEIISSQIKTHYLKLSKQGNDQKEIFEAMVAWLKKQTKQEYNEASEIIISYFIQNCEIF